MSEKSPGRFRRAFSRLTADEDDQHDEELRRECAEVGAQAVDQCDDNQYVRVAGVIRQVVIRPMAGSPALEAELWDGSGSVRLMFLGRRRITGIEAGTSLVATGRISVLDGQRVVYNPRYELRSLGSHTAAGAH